ncbi:MAG: zf-HC2 domain-containing protein [Gemmatimonadota bacterium]|nr:MAG: zf-HC2 domain-containing protein [Gemmatimonadota bacterium]
MSHIDEGSLHAYLDGAATERERQEIAAHVAGCVECRKRLDRAASLSSRAAELLAELEPRSAQPPSWREIEERASARGGGAARRRLVRPSIAWAASIALAFGVGWLSSSYWAQLPAGPDALSPNNESRITGQDANEAQLQVRTSSEEDAVRTSAARPATEPEPPAVAASRGGATEGAPPPAAAPLEVSVPRRERAGELDDARAEPIVLPALAEQAATDRVAAAPAKARADEPALEREAALEKREQPAVRPEQVRIPIAEMLAQYEEPRDGAEEGAGTKFFAVQPEDAAVWLGSQLRTLPELHLKRVELGPGSAIPGGRAGLPAVKLIYADAAGSEIVLIQQLLGSAAPDEAPELSAATSAANSYRWTDGRYLLILQGSISADSLRALADRVR